MTLACCLFAVHVGSADAETLMMRRAELVRSYLAPLGPCRLSTRFDAASRCLAGCVRWDDQATDFTQTAAFGRVPDSLRPAEALRGASDPELRALDGLVAAMAVTPDSTVIATGCMGPVSLYRGRNDDLEAFSTHAVVAGLLARGRAAVDRAAIPELLAFQFVGGRRTTVEEVEPVAAATRIELTPRGVEERSYWSPAERWAPVDFPEAQGHGETALLEHLGRRLDGVEHAYVGMTAGLDSRVVALALSELGRPVGGITWGDNGSDDARGARSVAGRLQMPHRMVPADFYAGSQIASRAQADVRWTEGMTHVALATPCWPDDTAAFLTGGAGEIGRCFYLAFDPAARAGDPTSARLAAFLAQRVSGRLAGAAEESVGLLQERAAEWIREAATAGHTGWNALDVVYGEQRYRRWGRAMQPQTGWPMVAAFGTPEVARALFSAPLEDRLGSGFHRRFIERRASDLLPASAHLPPPRRRSIPRAALRRLRALSRGRGETRYPSLLPAETPERDELRAWLADEIIAAPMLADVFGRAWVERTRRLVREGDGLAEDLALWAAGPVVLGSVLGELALES